MAEKQIPSAGDSATPQSTEKKFADKYASVEELEKAYKEAESKITELADKVARSEELLNVYMTSYAQVPQIQNPSFGSTAPATPAATAEAYPQDFDYTKITENPKEVFDKFGKELENRIVDRVSQLYQQDKYFQSIYNYFYTKHPDLKEHQPIVGFIASEVQRQNPNLPIDKLLEKVAERSREYIGKIRSQGTAASQQTPIQLAEGSSGTQEVKQAVTKPEETEKLGTEEERLQEYMQQQAERRKKFLAR